MVIVLALVFMMILSVITGSYIFLVTHGMRLANAQENDVKAFYLAEAGLHKAVWYLMNTAPDGSTDGSWRTGVYSNTPGPDPHDPREEVLDEGRYVIWVEDVAADIQITAQGEINNTIRTVRQLFSEIAPPAVVEDSWREI